MLSPCTPPRPSSASFSQAWGFLNEFSPVGHQTLSASGANDRATLRCFLRGTICTAGPPACLLICISLTAPISMTVWYLSRSLTFSCRLPLARAPDPSSSVQVLLGLTFSVISNMQIERSRLFSLINNSNDRWRGFKRTHNVSESHHTEEQGGEKLHMVSTVNRVRAELLFPRICLISRVLACVIFHRENCPPHHGGGGGAVSRAGWTLMERQPRKAGRISAALFLPGQSSAVGG